MDWWLNNVRDAQLRRVWCLIICSVFVTCCLVYEVTQREGSLDQGSDHSCSRNRRIAMSCSHVIQITSIKQKPSNIPSYQAFLLDRLERKRTNLTSRIVEKHWLYYFKKRAYLLLTCSAEKMMSCICPRVAQHAAVSHEWLYRMSLQCRCLLSSGLGRLRPQVMVTVTHRSEYGNGICRRWSETLLNTLKTHLKTTRCSGVTSTANFLMFVVDYWWISWQKWRPLLYRDKVQGVIWRF